jgi:RNA polymerase subunit RPABC4/transcription elongation factor Spt4
VQKEQVVCPHCGKKKFKIEFSPEEGIKKVNATWYPLIQQLNEREWDETWGNGIAILCKCSRFFFVYDFGWDGGPLKISPTLMEGFSLAVFCKICGKAFIEQTMTCPSCETRY